VAVGFDRKTTSWPTTYGKSNMSKFDSSEKDEKEVSNENEGDDISERIRNIQLNDDDDVISVKKDPETKDNLLSLLKGICIDTDTTPQKEVHGDSEKIEAHRSPLPKGESKQLKWQNSVALAKKNSLVVKNRRYVVANWGLVVNQGYPTSVREAARNIYNFQSMGPLFNDCILQEGTDNGGSVMRYVFTSTPDDTTIVNFAEQLHITLVARIFESSRGPQHGDEINTYFACNNDNVGWFYWKG
jgi:hypothetical protein